MKPHKMWGFILDSNCLTFRYQQNKMGGNNEFFENFERNKYLKKLTSMQRVKSFVYIYFQLLGVVLAISLCYKSRDDVEEF